MPVATSSMSTNAFARRQFTRQLWSNFYLGAVKVRQSMDQERNMALKAARSAAPRGHLQEQQRLSIAKEHEKRYFFMMRSEWDRTLRDNGLEHEDWGDITPQEMSAICAILGPPDLDADEESHQPEIEEATQIQLSRPPIEVAPPRPVPQPLSQSISHQSQSSVSTQYSFSSANASYGAPSMSSRSQNTSSAGYARIDPRNFTDDERNDSFGQLYDRNGSDSAIGGDEEGGILVPRYQTWEREDQQPLSAHLPNQGFINHSPAEYPASHSYQHHHSTSSSVQFPSHASSFSRPVPAEFHNNDDPDRLFMPAPGHTPTVPSSSAAAVPAPVSATAARPKSKLRSEYIGPQLTTNDSENEADADFASMSKADQTAAYEKFKWDVRVQKIREFHNEAAELDIELASKIDHVLNDRAATAQLIAQHAHDMSTLQHTKEEERKREVDKERSRMKDEIRKVRPGGSGQTQKKKKKGATTTSTAKDTPNHNTSPPAFPASSSHHAISTPPVPTVKRTPGKSSPAIPGFGAMNLDGLQSVFDSVPDVGLDTAFQISQLIQGSVDVPEHQTSYDSDWNTPQPNPKRPNFPSNPNSGARNRSESISVLGGSDSRFGNLNAKKAKQRGATVTVPTPTDADNNEGMFWKPQAQQASPEESRLLTDQYAQYFVGGEDPMDSVNMMSASSGAADHHGDDENDWVGWNQQPAPKTSGAGKAKTANASSASAWTKKPTRGAPVPAGSSSPSMGTPGSWGASVKKTLGFGGGNNTAVGGGGQWEAWGREDRTFEDGAMVEEEEERDELVRPSPLARQRKPSMLSDMMAKGRNVVAGAVGAALGPISTNGSSPNIPPQQFPSRPAGKNSSAAATISPPSTASSTNMPTTAAGKKVGKKPRQTANKKGTLTSTNQEEESREQPEMQPHLITPRAVASSPKFASAFGSANNTSASNQFGFGTPTSRSGAPTGGMWDDMTSTTPRPNIMSGTFGGRTGNLRRPSGLQQQVWNAGEEEEREEEEDEDEDEEEEEEEDEEEEADEQEWSMPGSLNPRGAYRPGPGSSNSSAAWGAPTTTAPGKKAAAQNANNHSAWGRSSKTVSASQSTHFASAAGPKKGRQQSAHTRVTMEEIPDESDDKLNRSPSEFLAVDSRYVMEPRPSKPAAAYDDIIHYGEGSSPEDMRHRPTATNKRSPPSKKGTDGTQDDDLYNQEWYQRAALQLQQGTEKGTRLFGEQPNPGGIKSTQPRQANGGMNIPNHSGSGPRADSDNQWATPSSIPSHMAGSISASYKDSSPLASGPPPKLSSAFGNTTGASKPSSKSAWGAGKSSSPNVGVGLGKTFNAKAKPTIGTSTGFGAGGGFGWADATPMMSGGSGAGGHSYEENDPWGQGSEESENVWEQQKPEEEQEREEELIKSRKKLQEMFDDSNPGSKPGMKGPGKGVSGAATTAKQQREIKQREEREREQQEKERLEREAMEREVLEREAREREEQEEQEKAAEEAKAKAAAAAKPTPQPKATGGKRGKGKKR